MFALSRLLPAAGLFASVMLSSLIAEASVVVVLNSGENSISVINTEKREEIARTPIGREPHHLMLTPDKRDLVVANAVSNELVFLDPATGKERRRIKAMDPYQIGFSPDGKWLISNSLRLDRVDIYSAADYSLVKRIALPAMPSHMAFAPDSSRVYITLQGNDKLAAIDLVKQTVIWTAVVGSQPAGVWLSPSNQLLVGIMGKDYVAVVDPANGKVLRQIKTGKGAHNLFPAPDNKTVYVSNRLSNTLTVLDAKTYEILRQISVPNGPDCIDFAPGGKEFWVTSRWGKQVHVVDVATGTILRSIDVGRSPHGIYIHAGN